MIKKIVIVLVVFMQSFCFGNDVPASLYCIGCQGLIQENVINVPTKGEMHRDCYLKKYQKLPLGVNPQEFDSNQYDKVLDDYEYDRDLFWYKIFSSFFIFTMALKIVLYNFK